MNVESNEYLEVNMKKKIGLVILAIIMMVICLAGCGEKSKSDSPKKLSVVTTIFPEYDWVKQIMGDNAKNADITMLLDKGVDLHSYQPSAKDIAKISKCDVFIYVGGESDEWVKDALKEATNKNMKVINLLDVLGKNVKEEEVKEGMEADEDNEEESHDHDKNDKDKEDDPEKDEHVWLSLKNAQIINLEISKVLSEVDKDNSNLYKENVKKYNEKLKKLDSEYKNTVKKSKKKTLVFGDRFPFRYLVEDYNLDYFAAFVGCSAESEASFKTIKFLADKVDELGLTKIMTIEKNDHKIAKTIIKNTKNRNQEILTMDSMQSTTKKDVENGKTYFGIMNDNLAVLKSALK